MPIKVRVPSDPLICLIVELNHKERPEWEDCVKKWMKKNEIELEE